MGKKKGKKGRNQDDGFGDDDGGDPLAAQMTVGDEGGGGGGKKNKKKNKKNRNQDFDDEPDVDPLAGAAGGDDDDFGGGGGGGKKNKKKNKKNKGRRDDDDDADEADPLANAGEDGAADDGEDDAGAMSASQRKKDKKKKKKNKGGGGGFADLDDDDADPLANAGEDEDEDEAVEDEVEDPAPVLTKAQRKKDKKNKKKNKGGGGGGGGFADLDDEDADPLADAGDDAVEDEVVDDEPEAEDPAPVLTKAQRKKDKKNKKKNKGKGGFNDDDDGDDDVDMLTEIRQEMGKAADDDHVEDEEAEMKAAIEASAQRKKDKKNKKKQKGSSGGDGDGDGEAAEAADAEPEAAQEPEPAAPEPEAAKEAETAVEPEPEAPAEPEAAKAEEPAAADEPKKEAVVEDEEELDYDDPRAKAKRKEARRLKKEAEMAANGGLTKKELKALKKKQKAEAMLNPEQPKTLEGTFDVVQRSDAGAAVIENALDITASGFSIRAAGNVLFENTTLNIANGRKYGLVGPNGHGKTTLLRHIAERKIDYPGNIDSLLCEQEVEASDKTSIEVVLAADSAREALIAEEKDLLAKIESDETDVTTKRLEKVYEELRAIGADAAEGKARKILSGLGFVGDMMERPTKNFSGGWRMRVSLARALFIEPTLLMLDEPTNHLDLNAVIWLDDYLRAWKKTLLIVSHDQDFLDYVCDGIILVHDKKLKNFKGNYTSFKSQHKSDVSKHKRDYDQQQRRIKEEKKKGQSSKKADAKVAKAAKAKREPKNKKKKGQAQMQDDGDDEGGDSGLLEKYKDYIVKFHFPTPGDIPPPVLGMHDVTFRYAPETDPLFEHVEFGIDMDSRVAIVGNNGVGKSTFLNLLIQDLEPTKGEVRKNPRVRIGFFSQHSAEALGSDESPVDYLRREFDLDMQDARKTLGQYALDKKAHTIPLKQLSGGQKARVAFAAVALREPDVLILDEPTNNLDIESIQALIDSINSFEGAVIIVSHDARLILEANCNLYECADRNCLPVDMSFDDYRDLVLARLEDEEYQEVEGKRVNYTPIAQRQEETGDGTAEVWA